MHTAHDNIYYSQNELLLEIRIARHTLALWHSVNVWNDEMRWDETKAWCEWMFAGERWLPLLSFSHFSLVPCVSAMSKTFLLYFGSKNDALSVSRTRWHHPCHFSVCFSTPTSFRRNGSFLILSTKRKFLVHIQMVSFLSFVFSDYSVMFLWLLFCVHMCSPQPNKWSERTKMYFFVSLFVA